MNLGFAKETAKASAEFDPTAEFKEGVKPLKTNIPRRCWCDCAGVRIRQTQSLNTLRSWIVDRARSARGSSRRSLRVRRSVETQGAPVPPESRRKSMRWQGGARRRWISLTTL